MKGKQDRPDRSEFLGYILVAIDKAFFQLMKVLKFFLYVSMKALCCGYLLEVPP